jgi:hypothetical protein
VSGAAEKIEIIKPFEEAFGLTKRILFEPFNFEKWLIIGFAAFLTHLNLGGGYNFNFPFNGNWGTNSQAEQENIQSFMERMTPGVVMLIGITIILALVFLVAFTWIRARGHFIFIDCIVKNRGAIVQPWKEYRAEGNSYFLFLLCFIIGFVASIMAIALLVILSIFLLNPSERGAIAFLPLVSLIIILPALLLFLSLAQFVAPVMYRRRCAAWPAVTDVLTLLGSNLGVFILYVLFSFVVGIGIGIAMVMLVCMTCCIAAVPYVGTVMLLPVYVFLQAFSLLFIRQFGPDFDVWAGIPATPPPPLTQPPPLPT